jgi:hypothetical protein
MRSEWIPLSASALITGAMALVLSQLLDPTTPDGGSDTILMVAESDSGRWLATSLLFFASAVGLLLGMPSLLSLLTRRRGRVIGLLGIAVFSLGVLGLTGFSGLMLMIRSLATHHSISAASLEAVLEDPALELMLMVWKLGFLGGVFLIGLALFRAGTVPGWVPLLFAAFLLSRVLPSGTPEVFEAVGLMFLAAGFTGVATNAAAPEGTEMRSEWG